MKHTRSSIIVLFAFVIALAYGQNNSSHYFWTIDIDKGLSQNTVNTILQDDIGFMWFGTKDGLNRYDGVAFEVFSKKDGVLGNNTITALYQDKSKQIWIGTDAGVYIYSPNTEVIRTFNLKTEAGTFITQSVSFIIEHNDHIYISASSDGLFRYSVRENKLEQIPVLWAGVTRLFFDENNVCWISFYSDNLYYSTDDFKTFHPFISNDGTQPFKGDIINKIIGGSDSQLYIGSSKGGLRSIHTNNRKVENLISTDQEGNNLYVREIIPYSTNELWIGTESGLYIYQTNTGKTTHIVHEIGNPYSISDNAIYSMCKDKEGSMWIGSYFGGLSYYPKQLNSFEKKFPRDGANYFGERVREFVEDEDGSLWIGTEDNGLARYYPQTGEIKQFKNPLIHSNVHGLCLDGDYLWVGTFSRGVSRIDRRNGTVKRYWREQVLDFQPNDVFSIYKTKDKQLLLGTSNGLYRYDYIRDVFERDPGIPSILIFDIHQDALGNLWLATYENGLYKFDAERKEWMHYAHSPSDNRSLPYNKVLSIFEDSKHQLWISTEGGGFARFDYKNNCFHNYNSDWLKLPSDIIYQMIEDEKGFLWLTTNKGLVRFDSQSNNTQLYTITDGLLSNQFNYKSSHQTKLGRIYLGCTSGFISFVPATFKEYRYNPPVVITDFLLFNKKVQPQASGSLLTHSITYTDAMTLSYKQNSISLRIAALSYLNTDKNKLLYKLENYDTEWKESMGGYINYSNLPHGLYTFYVKGMNNEDQQTVLRLNIKISPPFYLTVWAFILYTLLLAFIIYRIARYYRNLVIRQNKRQMKKFEQEKERELYNAKFNFYTNIAHEIRTPLTLIKGPLEAILREKELDNELRQDLDIMNRNSDRLLSLTNQLLDFRKIESNQTRLIFSYCNITDILRYNYQLFIPLIKQRELQVITQVPKDDIFTSVDKEALNKIISNLLSNAVKHALTEIELRLYANDSGTEFCIEVSNDGPSIPMDMREEIFKPFVQIQDNKESTGTGIGLALSHSLVELHQGSMIVADTTEACTFLVKIPMKEGEIIKESAPAANTISPDPEQTNKGSEIRPANNAGLTLLIVEDNGDMMDFVAQQLRKSYTVLTAEDGQIALGVLKDHTVHLIISDVMMPNMDGLELCKTVKADIAYSHIPVILLTAKADIESKIEGLQLDADSYIEKPFSIEYLKASITSLLNNRTKLRQAYLQSPFVYTTAIATTKTEELFLKRLSEAVNENMENPEFNVDDLTKALGMSRTSLTRKIKESLDMSPNDYIRIERLKKAAFLLKEKELYINEVCIRVGFNTPSYFSKCFQQQFGVLPKDFTHQDNKK